jgi:hypothetical protein
MIDIDTNIVLRHHMKHDLVFARRRQDDRTQHHSQN